MTFLNQAEGDPGPSRGTGDSRFPERGGVSDIKEKAPSCRLTIFLGAK
jgi:hypothetical protein